MGLPDQDLQPTTAQLLQNDPELLQTWNECLKEYTDGTPQQRVALLNAVMMLRNDYLRALADVADPIEREFVTVMFYVQVKSQWTILNIRSGYLLANGRVDLRGMCYSGLLSALLGRVEKELSPEQLDFLTQFLSSPFPSVVLEGGSLSQHQDLRESALRALQSREKRMVELFGSANPDDIYARFQQNSAQTNLLGELEDALNSIERSMRYVAR